MDKIVLADIRVMGTHGVNPLEKILKQPFIISVAIYLDLQAAALSDDLEDTVDYGALYHQIKDHAENSRYNLLEALAGSIADLLLEDSRVRKVEIKVEKTQTRAGSSVFPAAVVLERKRPAGRKKSAQAEGSPAS
ncbi:MAG: dihydroneopterin aldolase [Clostridia bacterium]|nr:dihydroneopterin aldolase [Clostridia bacterium]